LWSRRRRRPPSGPAAGHGRRPVARDRRRGRGRRGQAWKEVGPVNYSRAVDRLGSDLLTCKRVFSSDTLNTLSKTTTGSSVDTQTKKLSRLQKRILKGLSALDDWRHDHPDTPFFGESWKYAIPLTMLRRRGMGRTRANSAAFSRALSRLESRGLLMRTSE